MIANDIAQRLHDRATRGEPLSAEERAILDAWYAQQDAEEAAQLEQNPSLSERMKNILTRMALLTEEMQAAIAESKQLQEELAALYQPSLEAEADIREAYPLMDAVARREGWDDPEMDSYNIYARKPQP
jgi:hypothetical protein